MQFINKEIEEKDLIPSIIQTLTENGWTDEGSFWRVMYDAPRASASQSKGDMSIVTPWDKLEELPDGEGYVNVRLTKHYIVTPPIGKMSYGIAVTGMTNRLHYSEYDEDSWVANDINITSEENIQVNYYEYNSESLEKFAKKTVEVLADNVNALDHDKIYVYMIEKLPEVKDYATLKLKDEDRIGLDLEVYGVDAYDASVGSLGRKLTKAQPDIMQSPFSVIRTRSIETHYDQSLSEEYPINSTNWHDDSLFELIGYVDDKSAFLVMQADSAPAFDNNTTPSIPLFLGQFTPLSERDDRNYAIIAGSAFKKDDPEYDFDSTDPFDAKVMQPILKNYVSNPGNGIDNIIVYRSRGGAYYQAHHLYVESSPNDVEPPREYNKRKYPSAWSQADAEAYNYQMNPSRYSGEVHASRIYIAHMDEGVRGYLDGLIGMNPLSLLDGDTLKVKVEWCEGGYDEYEYKVLSSVSPFTKYPSTPFRPLGLGIIKDKYEEDK